MTRSRDYEDIPGTYVYDAERGRLGYALNMFCMSLNKPENRQRFKDNVAGMMHVMRGALDENAAEVYRHYHVPASNTAAGLMILENRSAG
jgi:protocatechuate 4,5-dioxygenase alpha chain